MWSKIKICFLTRLNLTCIFYKIEYFAPDISKLCNKSRKRRVESINSTWNFIEETSLEFIDFWLSTILLKRLNFSTTFAVDFEENSFRRWSIEAYRETSLCFSHRQFKGFRVRESASVEY